MQASKRHAAFRPALAAAAAELQAWFNKACPTGQPPTLHMALYTQSPSGGSHRKPVLAPAEAGESDPAADGETPIDAEQRVDFAALHALKHVLHPKLTWESAAIATSGRQAQGSTHASQWRPDAEQQQYDPQPALETGGEAFLPQSLAGTDEPPIREASCHDSQCYPPSDPILQRTSGSCNLYDVLIRNCGDSDAAAADHEAQVVLPPRSAFLMSDVTRLGPLLPGAVLKPLASVRALLLLLPH